MTARARYTKRGKDGHVPETSNRRKKQKVLLDHVR